MVNIMPTCAVSIWKLLAMSDNSPTGTNSVVLKINAAMASVTTRSHATLRETVFVVIGMSEIRCKRRGDDLKALHGENSTIM